MAEEKLFNLPTSELCQMKWFISERRSPVAQSLVVFQQLDVEPV